MKLFSYKKPYLWIALAAALFAAGLTVCLFIIFSPPESPKQPDHPPVAKRYQEAEITEIKEGVLDVQTRQGQDYFSQRIRVDHLEDLPELRVQDKIIMTYNAATGELLQITRKENPVTKLNGSFKGMVISQNGKYVKVRVDSTDAVTMVYVNISGFPELPTLNPGDIVSVQYNPGMVPTQMDDVTELRLISEADWGVSMRVSDVTPTGMRLWYGAASGFPRALTTTDAFYLEQKKDNNWLPLTGILEGAFTGKAYSFGSGNIQTVSWENIYGSLEPGHYRFCKTVSYQGEDRLYNVEFTINAPLTADLEEIITRTVRYLLSRQLINPSRPHSKVIEHIQQPLDTGYLDKPAAGSSEAKTFQQITESHIIIDRQQNGDEYTFSILGMCCGYNHRVLKDTFFSPMLLVLQKNADGSFTATSCKMPTQLSWQADIEQLFPGDIAMKMLDRWMQRDSLETACNKQVSGGGIQLLGMGKDLDPESTEGKLLLQTIKSGKKQRSSYSSGYVMTLFLGETVYYYYIDAGIVHNVTDNIYIQLTEEGQQTFKTILELKQ